MIKFRLVQLKHKPNVNDNYPICVRLTKDRKSRYLSTKIYCKLNAWNAIKDEVNAKCKDAFEYNILLSEFKQDKETIYNNLELKQRKSISLDDFINLVKGNNNIGSTNLIDLLDIKIQRLLDTGKVSTSNYYKDCRNSILTFTKKKHPDFSEINYEWLIKYETFLKTNNCINSGIAVKMRAIRSLYNEAITTKKIKLDSYPFKDYKISKLKGIKQLRALNKDEVQSISTIDLSEYPHLKFSKDLFLFSFYNGGMNFIDMMKLKHSDVFTQNKELRISYTRSKTSWLFNFRMLPPAKEIYYKYKKLKINTEYLFPLLLSEEMTPKQIAYRKHKTLSKYNKDLKEIGFLCDIDFDITSYVARHSFASVLKSMGVPSDLISEMMGHQDKKTTEAYLGRFDNIKVDNALEQLL